MDTETYKSLCAQYDAAGYAGVNSPAARHLHAVAGYLRRFLEKSSDGGARNRDNVAARLGLVELADPTFATEWIAAVRKALAL